MSRTSGEFSAIRIEDVRRIRGHSYRVLRRSPKKIPVCAGVYIWRYWPNIPSLDSTKLGDFLAELQENMPKQIEELRNSRVAVSVKRTPFGSSDDGRLLGIKGQRKVSRLLKLLDEDESKRQAFAHTLEILISSFPPIYIGKADNLRARLSDHFDEKTEVVSRIEDGGIPDKDIYISFVRDHVSVESDEITSSLEEILQRLTNPTYTKRYG